MKLRIKGNSIRLRVSRSELAMLAETGRVEDAIQFAPGDEHRLAYSLQASPEVKKFSVRHTPREITVMIPAAEAEAWWDTDRVGLEGEQRVGGDQTLAILVEKDFACFQPRPGEDAADAFPNPGDTRKC